MQNYSLKFIKSEFKLLTDAQHFNDEVHKFFSTTKKNVSVQYTVFKRTSKINKIIIDSLNRLFPMFFFYILPMKVTKV